MVVIDGPTISTQGEDRDIDLEGKGKKSSQGRTREWVIATLTGEILRFDPGERSLAMPTTKKAEGFSFIKREKKESGCLSIHILRPLTSITG